jgi:flagellar protein FliS
MRAELVQRRYLQESSETASPGKLVVMLYDALVADLVSAQEALARQGFEAAHHHLVHAQSIVVELLSALDAARWDGGPALANLYVFLLRELVAANVERDERRVQGCRTLIEPLRDAWHDALGRTGLGRVATESVA